MNEGTANAQVALDCTIPWKTASGDGTVAGDAGSNVANVNPVAGCQER